jgi:hypothetical protein
MQNNAFYRGVLSEINKFAQVTPPTPQITPSAPSPVISGIKAPLLSQTQHTINDFESVYPKVESALPNIEKSISSIPDNQLASTTPEQFKNTVTPSFSQMLAHPINSASLADNQGKLNDVFTSFQNLPPEQQAVAINTIGTYHPDLAKFLSSQIERGAKSSFSNASWSDLGSAAKQGLTGDHKTLSSVMMQDPKIKSLVTNSMLGRAGELSGQWLKNNWQTLASVIGGTALIGLVYSIMKNTAATAQATQQTQQNSLQPRLNAPQSL